MAILGSQKTSKETEFLKGYIPTESSICGLGIKYLGKKNSFNEDMGQIFAINTDGDSVPVKTELLVKTLGYTDPSFFSSLSSKVTFFDVLRRRGFQDVSIILERPFSQNGPELTLDSQMEATEEKDGPQAKGARKPKGRDDLSSLQPSISPGTKKTGRFEKLDKIALDFIDTVFIYPQLNEIPRSPSVKQMRLAASEKTVRFGGDQQFKLVASLYDKIVQMLSYAPAGATPSLTETSYFQMIPNGIPINLAPYVQNPPITPLNVNGDMRTTEEFSNLASMCFDLDGKLVDTLNVEHSFDSVIHSATSTQPIDEKALAVLEKVKAYLTKQAKDPFTGDVYTTDSDDYAKYKKALHAYQAALATYMITKDSFDLTKPDDQRKWQAASIALQGKIDDAKSDLDIAGATVQRALTYLQAYGMNAVQYVIKNAKDTFDQSALKSQILVGTKFHVSYGFPSDWYADDSGYTAVTYNTSEARSDYSDKAVSYGGSTSFSEGIFSVNASFRKSDHDVRAKSTSENISLSFKLATIAIQRPWLDATIFGLDAWSYQGQPAGKISSGKFPGKDPDLLKRTMPYIPSSFVIAKDIKVSGKWSEQDKKIVDSSLESSASVGIGPFSISGDYSSKSHTEHFHSTDSDGTFTVPGAQIIGFINTITPYAAPE